MNFWQSLALKIEQLTHPEAAAAVDDLANALEANKSNLVAKFTTAGTTVGAFIDSEFKSLATEYPEVGVFLPFVQPDIDTFISTEIGYGTSDVGPAIDKFVAFLRKEEAVV